MNLTSLSDFNLSFHTLLSIWTFIFEQPHVILVLTSFTNMKHTLDTVPNSHMSDRDS